MTSEEYRQYRFSILVVDDEPQQRILLKMLLEKEGFSVVLAADGREALRQFETDPGIRMIIADLNMPIMGGIELIREIRRQQLRYAYVIVLTAAEDRAALLKALSEGADDFMTKPAMAEELQLRIENGLRVLQLEGQEELIFALAKLAEYRSDETGFHLERVRTYTHLLAMELVDSCPEMGVTSAMAEEIALVSPLHDIGKVAIGDSILHKPGKLTAEEFETMKSHAMIGGSILEEIYLKAGSPYLQIAFEIAAYHHEQYNGAGYPNGLSGEDIPLAARIMALADVYDALTSKRCYRDALSHERAREMILEKRGLHFDPRIVDAFLEQEDIWLTVQARLQDEL